jgi:hypothetical protein
MKITVVLLCLAFTIRTSSQTTYTTDSGPDSGTPMLLTAQSKLSDTLSPVSVTWTYDAQQELLNLRLVNNSGKDITAYSMSISINHSDGSEMMEDMLGSVIYPQQDHGFAAGTTKLQHVPAKDISDVVAVVDMVIYADATAYVQNDRAFKNLMAVRKGQLMAMQKVDEVLKRALTEPNPISAALAELTPMLVAALGRNQVPENPEDNQKMELQSDVQNLRSMQGSKEEREWLTRYAEDLEKRIAAIRPHCEIVVAK